MAQHGEEAEVSFNWLVSQIGLTSTSILTKTKCMKKILFFIVIAMTIISCADNNNASTNSAISSDSASSSMSQEAKEERNKEVALACQRTFETGRANVDSIVKDAAPDFIDYNTGEMPPTRGLDRSKAFLQQLLNAFPDYKLTDPVAVADDDYVMVYGTWSGTWKNDFMGMKATNKSFKYTDVDIFKFNDEGKIIEHRAVQSMNEMSRQIGMIMPEAPKQ